ncbi:hypothetical protein [Clostridium rectalis]|uniref:hypothetical protein n=1 Tax=Clostridium rectalis TaxID=2040295 RepID=UPI000F62EBA6|nr:hypothetical protein [Clostridium rectalis]
MQNSINANNVWLPNEISVVKLFLVQIECSINEQYQVLGGKTLYEYTLLNKDYTGILKIAPELKNSPILEEYKKALSINKIDFLYQSVYKKSGGVLNLFYGEMKESMDLQLKKIISKHKNNNDTITEWKDLKSDMWSSLSPKLVWAGGGKMEKELLFDFCNKLTISMNGQKFYTQGSAIIKSLEYLRAWQLAYNDICKDSPLNAIIKERQMIYNRKIKFLKENNIQHDF